MIKHVGLCCPYPESVRQNIIDQITGSWKTQDDQLILRAGIIYINSFSLKRMTPKHR